ncbi:fimbrial protein [Entomohabitans teleogrylli]|uniref:fimbrial protein n=1 Tax=Entomohabitans teleogrylli TaxID=1384589 RepID=UPI00073D9E02|nr:fimbrial protein [Entomohabitans teleogrylli]
MKIAIKALISGAILFLFTPLVYSAANGTLTIDGKIIDGTCTVLGAATKGGTPSTNITVRLPQVSTGMTDPVFTGETFYIYLKGCRATATQKNIVAKFSSNNIHNNQTLSNTTTGGATNLGIKITHWYERNQGMGRGINILFDGNYYSNNIIPLSENQEDITIEYEAQYSILDTSRPLGAGRVTSTAYYDITYF